MSQHEAASHGRARIALGHSQQLYLDALSALLEADKTIDLVFSGTSSEALLEAVARHEPHVAVLELEMPGLHGLEVLKQAQQANTKSEFVLLGERRGPALTKATADAGARAYVATDAPAKILIEAIKAAADHRFFTGDARGAAVWTDKASVEALSSREVEVLRLLSTGLSSREIADKLTLSFRTVDGYRASLMDKLDIRNVPGLVKFALRHRLADLRE